MTVDALDIAHMGTDLSHEDREITAGAERALNSAVQLRTWLNRKQVAGSFEKKFKEAYVHTRPEDHSFGFFDTATIDGKKIKVIGNVQQQLFHRPKEPSPEFVKQQIRAFVLRYFMRVSVIRTPQPHVEERPDSPFEFLSQFPNEDQYKLQGFGYFQKYFKCAASGETRRFKQADETRIIELESLGPVYDWVMIRNPIVGFQMNIRPLGINGPELNIPIPSAKNWIIMSPRTVTIEDEAAGECIGRYGIGYAFMRDPGAPGIFAYGPGQLEPTIQLITWEVMRNGDVITKMTFVSGAPSAILNVSANPLEWGFTAANMLTADKFKNLLEPFHKMVRRLPFSNRKFDPVYPMVAGLNAITGGAAEGLGISKEEINKSLTYIHFLQHYNSILGSRQTWEMIPDWTDEAGLPDWVKDGKSI
jgi:hypothetical protein